MNWVKGMQEGLKLAALLGVIAVIIWTMPDQAVAVAAVH